MTALNEINNTEFAPLYHMYQMLLNKNKYIPIGKNPKLLTRITSSLKLVAKENEGKEFLTLQKQILRNIISERYKKQKQQIFVCNSY
jgi:hypothetical protein